MKFLACNEDIIESEDECKEMLIPRHLAIIMDGNRRWADKNNLPLKAGHLKGAEVLMDIVEACIDLHVQTVTVYAFSTENWRRSQSEVSLLMDLMESYLTSNLALMLDFGVRLQTIGDIDPLPSSLKKVLSNVKKETEKCSKIQLVLALNYGGRDELKRAFLQMADDYKEGKIAKESITENLISSYLDTKGIGDPDLLIRTSGEMRVSNFLLWQISYSEVYLTDVLWPDFKKEDLLVAIESYSRRNRRLGN